VPNAHVRVPGMCRAQIWCAAIVPWWAWGQGWKALQVIEISDHRTPDRCFVNRWSGVQISQPGCLYLGRGDVLYPPSLALG
jgi:hypothetical protein